MSNGTLQQAIQLLQQGRVREAEAVARAVAARDATNVGALRVLAVICQRLGQLPRAAALLERATSLAPDDVELRFELGMLEGRLRRTESSILTLRRVTEADPAHVRARIALAHSLELVNRVEEARTELDCVLSIGSEEPEALLLHASLLRREQRAADALLVLDRLCSSDGAPDLGPIRRGSAFNLRGRVLDKLERYDEAFESFIRAHRECAELPAFARCDGGRPFAALDVSRTLLTPDRIGDWRRTTPPSDRPDPAFLVGFPRSGTTMTEQICAAHPDVRTTDEDTPLAPVIIDLRRRIPGTAYPASVAELSASDVSELRSLYWRHAERITGGPLEGLVLLDKLPLLIDHMALIQRLFPDARVIVAHRDPRDVCLSCVMQQMVPNDEMVNLMTLEGASSYYAAVMDFWFSVRDDLTVRQIESRYEDVIADPETGSRRLLEFLDLDWDDGVLRFHERVRGRAIRTPSYEAVSQPINTSARGRWLKYRRQIEPIIPVLDPFLQALGYES